MAKSLKTADAALGLRAEQASLWMQDTRMGAGWTADDAGTSGGRAFGRGGSIVAPDRIVLPVLMPAPASDAGLEAGSKALRAGDVFQAKPDPVAPSAEPDQPVTMAPDLPTDPLFASQYYLRNTAAGQRDLALFRGDTSVWDEFTGAGVLVGSIDDGIDKAHVDLDDNYNAALETVDGSHPNLTDAHGTATSGIIAAERNGVGVVGIAYDAQITMMAAITSPAPITIEQSMDNAKNFDVVNNSWGYTNPWFDEFFNAAQATYYTELYDQSLVGRGGLGTVFVKSAGNGRDDSYIDNSNLSFTKGHWASVTVAAVLRTGFVSSYSSEGAANLVSAFGGPIPGDVVTTDRTGAVGYEVGDYTTDFNGTSAAAPMVTGIVALMLEANPELGYRDVQEILAMTARHTGSAVGGGMAGAERYLWEFNASTFWNGGGMHFSEDYGFGLVDALAAVRVAESWTDQRTRANLTFTLPTSTSFTTPITISDLSNFNVTFTLPTGTTAEQVGLDLGLNHAWSADLDITLTSPDGTVSELLRDNGGSFDVPDYPHASGYDVTLTSNMFRGEDSGGVWTLNIADDEAGITGTLSKVILYIAGRNDTDDTHVLTEEYSNFVTAPRQTIEDLNGGVDTLNAAGVFTSSFIDLTGGSAVDGVAFTIDGSIENAIGGDGADTLLGTNGANSLSGYRGKDSLNGMGGADTLDGGGAADNLVGGGQDDLVLGGLGADVMSGGSGIDTLDYSVLAGEAFIDLGTALAQNTHSGGNDILQGFENAITGAGDDRVLGAGAANSITTGDGVDTVKSGGGNDSIFGGDGADKLKGGGDADYILGGKGADQLRGGFGVDVFDYNAVNHSGVGAANRDLIQDFSTAEGDKIDLADVFGGTLAFIGATAFGGVGTEEVRVTVIAEGQLVEVDTDGDGDADIEILVQNSGLAGGAGDFVL